MNFEETIKQATIKLQVQANFTSIGVFAFTYATALDLLPKIFMSPLLDLPPKSAFWVTIAQNPVLIWRHQLLSLSVFELHTTLENAEAIKVKLM